LDIQGAGTTLGHWTTLYNKLGWREIINSKESEQKKWRWSNLIGTFFLTVKPGEPVPIFFLFKIDALIINKPSPNSIGFWHLKGFLALLLVKR